MGDDITIGVTEIVNNIEVTAQPNDQVVDINVTDNADEVTLNITPTVIEINVNKGSSFARWGSIIGNLTDQVDLTNALFNKADLVDGKVPSYQLPSFVDDVIEVANFAALPTVGETGKIYITLDNNKIYRWSGSVYIEIASNQAIWGAITGSLANQTDLVNVLDTKALKAITITPNAPLTGGGDLSANRTISITQSGAAADGFLSSTDWNTFNNKQGVITLTTNGTSGVSTLIGSTLNIPNYTTDISGLVPYTGATQDVNLGVHTLLAQDLVINHSNGSGVAASITKNGSGEALTVIKGSGSGNAASITGGVTLLSELHLTTDLADAYIASAATWNAKQNALNGTGFVKVVGTTVSYDNSTYALDNAVVKLTGDQSIAGVKTFTNLSKFTNNTGSFAVEIDTSSSDALVIKNSGTTTLQIGRNGQILGAKYMVSGGFSSQFLKANGDLDSNTYALDNAVVKLTGDQSIAGVKTFLNRTDFSESGIKVGSTGWITPNQVYADTTNAFYVNFSGSGHTIIGNSGKNVGIGTISPSAKLHVDSLNTATDTVGNVFISASDTLAANIGGQLTLGGFYNGSAKYAFGGIAARKENATSGNVAGYLSLMSTTSAGALTERMRINSSGQIEVKGTSTAANAQALITNSDTDFNIYASNVSGVNKNINFLFNGGSGQAMRITSNGELLIGRTSPYGAGWLLAVEGNMYAKNDLRVDGGGSFGSNLAATTTITLNGTKRIFLRSNQSASGGLLSGSALAVEGNFSIYSDSGIAGEILGMYYWNGSTYRSAIQTSNVSSGFSNLILQKDGGNVGIGTQSPSEILHLQSSQPVIRYTRTGILNWKVGVISGNTFTINTDASGGDAFNITSGGNVGIGTTSPNDKLQINDGRLRFLESGQRQWSVGIQSGTSDFRIREETFGFTPFTINGSGNVGIGTTSPVAKLSVRGADNTSSNFSFEAANGSGNSIFIVRNDGNVGIGTTSLSYTLHVNGSVAGTSAYVNLSDKRHKKDILPIEKALDKILALNGVTFNWDKESTDMNLDDNNHIGLIAQDVEKIIPQAVVTATDENETKSVAYTDLVPVLIEAIKELKAEIEILKNK